MNVVDVVSKYISPLIKKYGNLIKAVWVYGSSARGEAKKTSDIDVMVLLDDVSGTISVSDQQAISSEISRISEKARRDGWILHFQPPRLLTQWWDLMRSGEPWVLTGMRDSLIIYDPSGFVRPIKRLLEEGRLGPTKERSVELMRRVNQRKEKIRRTIVDVIISEILLAMTESAQAVLMYMEKPPVSASRIYSELSRLSSRGYIDMRFAKIYRDFYRLAKRIDRSGEIPGLSEIEEYMEDAKEFIEEMERLFSRLESDKQERIVHESFEEAMESMRKILRKYKISVSDEEQALKSLKELVDRGEVSQYYLDLLVFIIETFKKFRKSRQSLTEREIYNSRLYANTLKEYVEVLG